MRIPILGVEFDNVTMAEAVEAAVALMEKRGCYAVTPNPEMILLSRSSPRSRRRARRSPDCLK